MFQLTLCKSETFGWEVHMISDGQHVVKEFDTDIDAKIYFLTMAKDLAA